MKRIGKLTAWRKEILVLIITLAIGFIILEISARIKYPYELISNENKDVLYIGHPYLNFMLLPSRTIPVSENNIIQINSLGFRGPEFAVKKPVDTIRIFCLGGSFAFCYYNPEYNTWPRQIENMLNSNTVLNKKFEVINAGVPSYTTYDSLVNLMTRIIDYSPDIIIICHEWNDVRYFRYLTPEMSIGRLQKTFNVTRHRLHLLKHKIGRILTFNSRFLSLVGANFYHLFSKYDTEGLYREHDNFKSGYSSYGPIAYRRNLMAMAQFAKSNGIKVILVSQPRASNFYSDSPEDNKLWQKWSKYSGLMPQAIRKGFAECDAILKDVAMNTDSEFIDANKIMGGGNNYFLNPHEFSFIHLSDEGCHKFAEIISQQIWQELNKK